MFDLSTIIILTIIVIFLSTLSSISGMGGGVFIIPVMIILLNLPIKYIAGTMLLAMVPYTGIATLQNIRNGYVHFRIGLVVQIGAIVGVIVGAHYSAMLPNLWLKILFLAVVLYLLTSLQAKDESGFNLAYQFYQLLSKVPPHIQRNISAQEKLSISALTMIGFATGILSGLLGIGGGFMFVPLLIVAIGLPPKMAVGTSLFMILLTSSAGAIQHAFLGHIQYHLAVVLAAGMMIGATIGTLLLKKIREKRLTKIIFLILLFAVLGIFFR